MYEQIARNKRRSVAYVVAFIVIWMGIGALIGWWVGDINQAGGGHPVLAGLLWGVTLAFIGAVLATLYTLTSGARLVLSVAGARRADPGTYRVVYDLVEALTIGTGLPMPEIYVIDDASPNAFATGTSPSHAAVTVTTGLLAVMDREELEGVLAHEISHIRNYDTRLLLIVTTLIGMAGLLASLIWRSAFFVRGRGRDSGQFTIMLLLAGTLLAVVGFIVGPIIRLAISRRRESLADVSGVELTRNPAGLIRALRTLQANDEPLARTNHATAALCIDDPLQHHEGVIHRLFDTHPPLADRIAVLERIEQGLAV